MLENYILIKNKSISWPCKWVSENSEQEVVKVSIFNDEKTEVDVEVVKMKAFEPLKIISRTRTNEWRRAYEKALSDLNE